MKKYKLLIRFLRFSFIGLVNTVLHILIFQFLFNHGVHYLISQTCGFIIVNIITFACNKYWTFENSNPRVSHQVLLNYFGRSITLSFTLILTYILVEKISISPLISQVYVVIVNVVFNFVISQIFIFQPIPKDKLLYLAKSREAFENFYVAEKTTIYFIVPVYKEHHRMYPKSDTNPNGEDFINVKIKQISELMKWNPMFSWKLIFIDDNDKKYQSGKLIEEYTDKNYADLVKSGFIYIWYLDEIDKDIAEVSRKGGAVIAALKKISEIGAKQHDIAVYTDADISSDLRLTGSLIAPLLLNSNVAISSRWHEESTVVKRGVKEKLSSWVYNLIIYFFVKLDYTDTQNGFKAFKVCDINKLLPHANEYNFAFDTELLMLSEVFGFKITEVPIFWEDSNKETNVNLFSDTFQMLLALKKQRAKKMEILKSFPLVKEFENNFQNLQILQDTDTNTLAEPNL
jgi:putative flippase GtrA